MSPELNENSASEPEENNHTDEQQSSDSMSMPPVPEPPAPQSSAPVPPASEVPQSTAPVPPAAPAPQNSAPVPSATPLNGEDASQAGFPQGMFPDPQYQHNQFAQPAQPQYQAAPPTMMGAGGMQPGVATAPAATSNETLDSIKLYFVSLWNLFKGAPAAVFQSTYTNRLMWIWGSLFGALTFGIFVANQASLAAAVIDFFPRQLSNGYASITGFDAGTWIKIFFAYFISNCAIIAIYSGMMKAVFALRKVHIPFTQVANLVVLSWGWNFVIIGIVALLWFIQSGGTVGLGYLLLFIFLPITTLLSQLLQYVAVNRIGKFTTSIIVPYVLLSVVALWLSILAVYVVSSVFLG